MTTAAEHHQAMQDLRDQQAREALGRALVTARERAGQTACVIQLGTDYSDGLYGDVIEAVEAEGWQLTLVTAYGETGTLVFIFRSAA